MFTGLRISADARTAVFAKWIAPILPQGEVWTLHFIAGLALFFCLTAYVLYLVLDGFFPFFKPFHNLLVFQKRFVAVSVIMFARKLLKLLIA